ncbi:MAG: rhamnogalacturonan lyase [Mediterranea massiliensis]|nr:rhamnogalacturonan lyase [Mediterranea massiliensis]
MKKRFIGCALALVISLGMVVEAQPKYNFNEMKREKLGRGVIAVRQDANKVAISWRYLSSDPMQTEFNLYRDGEKIAMIDSGKATFYTDHYSGNASAEYTVKPVVNGKEMENGAGSYLLPGNAPHGFLNIPLDKPADGVTPAGDTYSYTPNDASIGDVDGDGNYEIILKWDPTNAHDNAHDGYTGNVYFDCYRLNGEKLWRIDMGHNVRAGAHYTQFMVFDLDGDGSAEVVMKTSDGTVDGMGNVIGDATADYREKGKEFTPEQIEAMKNDPRRKGRPLPANYKPTPSNQGRILIGNEYLTIFNGRTGKAMQTIDYIPQRGNLMDWGDNRANRSDRYLAAIAYLDGIHPSVIMCRGYYTRAVLAAFDWDGKKLTNRWTFDSAQPGWEDWSGQGNHNLRVGDVDGDGCDEIIYGSCAIDNNGKGLYSTRMGHGDAMHLTQFDPADPKLQVWCCHENRKDGSSFREAATGKVIYQIPDKSDVGRCMAADIDPTNYGVEMWSLASGGLRNLKGEVIASDVSGLSYNMAVWWDGDLSRELLDKNFISKYNPQSKACENIMIFEGCVSNNSSKSTPAVQGDLVGDWREEVLLRTKDNSSLRLYITTIPTDYRFHTFLEDPVYRISIATQNVAYNQPTQPGFYIGSDIKGEFRGMIIK